jgi:hypothetical protein
MRTSGTGTSKQGTALVTVEYCECSVCWHEQARLEHQEQEHLNKEQARGEHQEQEHLNKEQARGEHQEQEHLNKEQAREKRQE